MANGGSSGTVLKLVLQSPRKSWIPNPINSSSTYPLMGFSCSHPIFHVFASAPQIHSEINRLDNQTLAPDPVFEGA